MNKKKIQKNSNKTVAVNRRARHDYQIIEILEAGILLKGSEVKSVREGRASINEAFASDKNGELFLINAYIPDYKHSSFRHEPRGDRKLLLHRREILKCIIGIQRKGVTIVPLSIYFNERGLIKVNIAHAIGKRLHDKREDLKKRDWNRNKLRLLRANN